MCLSELQLSMQLYIPQRRGFPQVLRKMAQVNNDEVPDTFHLTALSKLHFIDLENELK